MQPSYPPSPDDKKTAANYPSTIFKVYDIYFIHMIRMVLKQFKRDNTYIILPLLLIACTFFCCHGVEKHNGFRLNEFAIDNVRLRAIFDSVVEMNLPILQSEKEKKRK